MEHKLEGHYALITGASEGMGKNMVIECASRHMHIIAVALPGKALEAIRDLIIHNYPVTVHAVGTDLTTEEGCRHVYETVRGLGLTIKMLINCAGANLTQSFQEIPVERCSRVIRLNALGTTLMTRYFIDDLMKNTPSYVLNVSSLGSFFHLPHKQVYGASKAFVYAFSRNMQTEFRNTGINITVLCPGGLSSNVRSVMANKETAWLGRESITSPEYVAKIAIDACLKGKEVIIPGKINKLFLLMNRMLPAPIKAMITTSQMKKLSEKAS